MKMKELIYEPKEVQSAVNQFRRLIIAASETPEKKEMNFPGGGNSMGIEYKIDLKPDPLIINIPEKPWNGRYPHLFVLNPGKGNYTSDLEINIYLGLNRAVSGCFVKSEKDISICHRGRFTIFKRAISKSTALSHFENKVITIDDGGKTSEVIEIVNLSSPDMTTQLAKFVKEVINFKKKIKDSTVI
jgi:hypothetical protein